MRRRHMKRNRTQRQRGLARFYHCRRRARERYDLDLSRALYNECVDRIERGFAKLVYRQSNTRRWYQMVIQQRDVVVVYHTEHKDLLTFLPREVIETLQ